MRFDITKSINLANALNVALAAINSPLKVKAYDDADRFPVVYARVERNDNFCQVYTAAAKNLYLAELWRKGVALVNGSTDDINLLAQLIDAWLVAGLPIKALQDKFPFVGADAKAFAFEENREVAFAWNTYVSGRYFEKLSVFAALAAKDPVLGGLFPYTSMGRLCFSRCTGYPYTTDTPIVIPTEDENVFEVKDANYNLVGSGTAQEALQMVKDNLPAGIKPAIKGTADDFY